MSRYGQEFGDTGAHGHARDLLARAGLPTGVVLDLGCASGPLAEPVSALGFEYVGADVDPAALQELAARGFEAHPLDLRGDDDALDAALGAILGDRTVVAVLVLDVIEHLVDAGPTLRAIARLGTGERRPLLVASIPNVSHVDVGAKLLAGRWDVTKIGLLDDTHVRFFNAARVHETMSAGGWHEVDEHDVVNPFSDQQFPVDAPVLRSGVPLRQLLARVRTSADPYGETYQFVRSFEHGAPATAPNDGQNEAPAEPFLSVVVRASGPGDGEMAVLRDLVEQTMPDIEVLVSYADADEAERPAVSDGVRGVVRLLGPEPDWRNGAIAQAEGRYLVFVDDRTRLAPDFVETIHRIAGEVPTRVVRVGAHLVDGDRLADAGRPYGEVVEGSPLVELDPLDLVSMQPFGSVVLGAHAVPRVACATTGVQFEPGSPAGSAALFLLRCIELCGIVRTPEPLIAVGPRALRSLADDLRFVADALGRESLIIPEGAGSYLLGMREILATIVPERDALAAQLLAADQRVGALSALLVQRQAELDAYRAADDRRVGTRLRRRIGTVARQI